MSTPCFDTADDRPLEPWEAEDTAWMGDIHSTSEWETIERTCGPEYWAYRTLLGGPSLTETFGRFTPYVFRFDH